MKGGPNEVSYLLSPVSSAQQASEKRKSTSTKDYELALARKPLYRNLVGAMVRRWTTRRRGHVISVNFEEVARRQSMAMVSPSKHIHMTHVPVAERDKTKSLIDYFQTLDRNDR